MPLISVITPVYQPDAGHLRAAYESLVAQGDLPAGWSLEWLAQEDGETGVAQEIVPTEPWIRHGVGRHNGVSLTRNLALSRAHGSLVRNLDQDDILTAGALARDIAALDQHPEIGWATSRVLDLLPDGSTVGFDNDPPAGRIEPGHPVKHWRAHNYRLPVHPTTLCIRRSLAVALGGWMAVPGSDDTGLLVAASTINPGWFSDEVGLLYRKWHGQASAAAGHTEAVEWQTRMNLISERADELVVLVRQLAEGGSRRRCGSWQTSS